MVWILLKTWSTYRNTDGRLLSGAITFYVLLAVAPLGVISLGIADLVVPPGVAERELVAQLQTFLGESLANFVAQAIASTRTGGETLFATVVGSLFVLYVSTRLFTMLRRALNHMWGIRPKPFLKLGKERFPLVRKRMVAFAMVFVFGSSLIVLVIARTIATFAAKFLAEMPYLLPATNFLTALLVLATLVALVYRWLPDAQISWRDVWVGALVTSAFVVGGSFLIGIYLGYASPASAYGAAGTLLVLLLWIYYTTQIFLMGAVFTRVWANYWGREILPAPWASRVTAQLQSASTSASEI